MKSDTNSRAPWERCLDVLGLPLNVPLDRVQFLFQHLLLMQVGIVAARAQQLVVRPLLNHAPVIEHDYAIGIPHG